ncbi:hypothetical protein [Ferrovum myxofaciens]|uniref:hypothetical protein n=1 Tax=Ferrovum myxofaciens TaxID=416213 RepID=UPI002355096D|nr:hypothetical protein [Ferrovum myxofaciens]MBU6993432.1 hypothetical protein [Ferrovum myxofaciens]
MLMLVENCATVFSLVASLNDPVSQTRLNAGCIACILVLRDELLRAGRADYFVPDFRLLLQYKQLLRRCP